jgi:sec-independent protein translocase protein TatA
MGSFSIWHWVIVLVVVLVLFGGRGKLSSIMGDAAKGIRAFQKGLKGDDDRSETDTPPGALPRNEAEREDVRR